MARPKKVDEKPKDSGSLQISVEDFVRTRNSVSNLLLHFMFIQFRRRGWYYALASTYCKHTLPTTNAIIHVHLSLRRSVNTLFPSPNLSSIFLFHSNASYPDPLPHHHHPHHASTTNLYDAYSSSRGA